MEQAFTFLVMKEDWRVAFNIATAWRLSRFETAAWLVCSHVPTKCLFVGTCDVPSFFFIQINLLLVRGHS
jgi:hypothetical protein